MALNYNKWTLHEKKRLADLLEIYPINAYSSIAKRIDGKNVDEVKNYIEKMIYSASIHPAHRVIPRENRAPLEDWLKIATLLVETEQFDASAHLSKIMSIIGHLEEFPESGEMPPVDYPRIYRYLAQVLQFERVDEVETLPPLECSVVLDMIHSLMDVLSGTDTTVHRNLMRWKIELMDDRDERGRAKPDNIRKAAENDFKEFIDEDEEKMSRTLMSEKQKELDAMDEEPIEVTSQDEASQGETSREKEIVVVKEERPDPITVHSTYTSMEDDESTSTTRTRDPDKVSITTASGKLHTYKRSWISRPGRKPKNKPIETEKPVTDIVVVMPPKNVKIVKAAARAKTLRKERVDGKYKVVEIKPDEINDISADKGRKISACIRETERSSGMGMGTSEAETSGQTPGQAGTSSQTSSQTKPEPVQQVRSIRPGLDFDTLLRLFEGRKRKYDQIREAAKKPAKKKPKLYSINPFCVPICLLDLDT